MQYTLDDINDATGFARGDLFDSEAEVREYFRAELLASLYDGDADDLPAQDALDDMADCVITEHWHCRFPRNYHLLEVETIGDEARRHPLRVMLFLTDRPTPNSTPLLYTATLHDSVTATDADDAMKQAAQTHSLYATQRPGDPRELPRYIARRYSIAAWLQIQDTDDE